MDKKRFGLLAVFSLVQNANFKGFFTGKIYQGSLKNVCVPGLNCYSCPGAVGACPIGSLQGFLSGLKFRVPYYIVGLLLFFGAVLGRAVCGLLCPFGFVQELLYLIPGIPKRNHFKADKPLRCLKYAVLLILVIGLPSFVALTPFFCKYLCPSGTLAGILLSIRDSMIRAQLGGIFLWKLFLLVLIAAACLAIWRPFCKYLCPLGAIYGLFNKFALYRMELDENACIHCGKCAKECRMCVDPSKQPNSPECVRCGDCVKACPQKALKLGFRHQQAVKESGLDRQGAEEKLLSELEAGRRSGETTGWLDADAVFRELEESRKEE